MNTIPTNKIWALAWPMILSNISVPLLGLVDTAVLGHLKTPHYLAAVALGSAIISFLYWGFGFLRMGITGMTAQAFGAGDTEQLTLIFYRGLLLATAMSSVIILLHPWLYSAGLWAMNSPQALSNHTNDYLNIRLLSAPAALINYVAIGWFIGTQQTKRALIVVVLCNTINILLDILLVVLFDMKSNGVAWATVIAEYASMGVALVLIIRQISTAQINQVFDISELLSLLKVNGYLFIRTITLLTTMAYFTRRGGEFGIVVLAANALLMQLAMLVSYGLDGFANAAEALIGEAIGKRDPSVLRFAMIGTADISAVVAIIFSLGLWLGQDMLIQQLTSQDNIRELAHQYYLYIVVFPCVAVWSFWLDGVFIGANRHPAMMWSMLFSSGVVFTGLLLLLARQHNHGLWSAYLGFVAARGLTLGFISYRYSKYNLWFKSA